MTTKTFRKYFQILGAVVVMALVAAPAATAQNDAVSPLDVIEVDDLIVEGSVCASDEDSCADGESFSAPAGTTELKLKDNFPSLWWDVSSAGDLDWELGVSLVGASNGTLQLFSDSAGISPVLEVAQAAPADSLVIGENGVSIGDSEEPDRPLRVVGDEPGKSVIQARNSNGTSALRTVFSVNNFGPPSFTLIDRSPGGEDWFFRSSNSGQFAISAGSTGVVEARIVPGGNMAIAGSLSQGSSREIKHGIEAVDTAEILDVVTGLEIAEWSYDHAPGVTHIGPMAEDMHEAFGYGPSSSMITTVDADGIALAAVQALAAENEDLRDRLAEQEAELAELKAAVAALTGS